MTLPRLLAWLRDAPPGTMLPAEDVLAMLEESTAESDPAPTDRATPPGNGKPADRLLSADDVAEQLGVSARYVYAQAHQWPFTRRLGRAVRFSSSGLAAWLSRQD